MKRIHLIGALLLILPFLLLSQEKEALDYSDAFELMDAWLEAQVAYDKLPGLSVSIIQDQDVIYSRAWGMANSEKGIHTRTNTIYSICSISKLFTSVAIMKLWDEGKLRLDDRIDEILPWYDLEQQFKDSGPITVRSLLTHSSGLPRESDFPYWTGPDFPFPTKDKVREKLGSQKTLYPAATYFQYSNLGLTLLGEVVEEISGQKYEDYIEEKILKPLRLLDTRPELPEPLYGSQLAIGYSAIQRNGSREPVEFFQAEGIKAAAGFSSTVEDLARFASWQFRLLDNGGQEILKASTLRDMQRVHYTDPNWNTTWGLGFSVYQYEGKTIVGHGGSCPGYRSVLLLNTKEKMAVSVMINAGGTNPGHYGQELMNILAKFNAEESTDLPDSASLEDYAGIYNQQPWWSESLISPWKGKLVFLGLPAENPTQSMTFYKYIAPDIFKRIREDDATGEEIAFEREASGKVLRYVHHSNYYYRIK